MIELIHLKDNLFTNVYIDYENIWALLQRYGTDPMALDFFPVILNRLKKDANLNIIDCIAYCNFERMSFNGGIQTAIQKFGIQTRHSANGTKNCSDLQLTVDALLALTKSPHIKVFVIVSSDRDMIPLLKAIKADNKPVYLISTRLGFNSIVAEYADYLEYIEDIFHLAPERLKINQEPAHLINEEQDYHSSVENAQEVTKRLFSSNIWKGCEKNGEPVTLKGYVTVISKVVNRSHSQIVTDFHLASELGYIEIVNVPLKGDCLRRGRNHQKILDNKCQYQLTTQREPG